MPVLFSIIIVSAIMSGISLIGGLMLLNNKLTSKKFVPYLVSFAAGVLLSATFLDLLPEALEKGDIATVLTFVLIGIVGSFIFEQYILWHHHHEDTHDLKPTAILILFGDAIHNFVDGVAIAATFLTSPALGITTAIAIASHEIPQELADFSILLHSGLKRKKALFYNFVSSLTALLGALLGFYFLSSFLQYLQLVIGLTAGTFIYISTSDLIPELHKNSIKDKKLLHTIPFLIGILLLFLITRYIA